MTKKSSVYTKTGDSGETGLVGGTRVSKSDERIDLYGEVDELNSWIGLASSFLEVKEFDTDIVFLKKIQSSLFDLGSNLACESDQRVKFKLPTLSNEIIIDIESRIDELDESCPKLTNFILPGGSRASSHFHVCRTVCRKIERKMVLFENAHENELPQDSLIFMNRLSDFFFVFSRYVNMKLKVEEVVWNS